MKKIIVFSFLLISLITHGQNDQRIKDSLALYAPTEIGKPDGEPVSQKIGKDGGTLISSDNKITLIIPAGALLSETLISIQPATNPAEGGVGKGYDLEPSGIQFQAPVQLIFHYTDKDMEDGSPQFMGITSQNEKGVWYGLKEVKLDTVSKTITGNIKHFSMWGLGWSFSLKPEKTMVKVSKTVNILAIPRPIEDENIGERMEVYQGIFGVNRENPRGWYANLILNGDADNGTFPGSDSYPFWTWEVGYQAPAKVPSKNPVEIMLVIVNSENGINGERSTRFRRCYIEVYDNRYKVKMVHTMDAPAGSQLGVVKYKDYGSFVVSLDGKEPKIIEIVNKNAEWTYNGKCTIVQLRPGQGNINIIGMQSIKLIPAASPGDNPWIEIFFVRSPTIFPLLQFTCPKVNAGGTYTTTSAGANAIGSMIPAFPLSIKFEAKEGEQTILKIGEEGGQIYAKFTVKQIRED